MTGSPPSASSRRQFLGYLGAAAAGAAASAPITAIALGAEESPAPAGPATPMTTISPYGVHQSGITNPTQRFVELVALDLLPSVDAEALGRLMRLWSGDVAALMAGRPAPGDTAPELVEPNADLTVTVGWGPGVFALPGLEEARPPGLHQIPPMRHDRLEQRWSGGDLLVLVGAHDGTSVAHALRRIVADAAPFATLRWRQRGFWNGFGRDGSPATGRNLFGQVDGSANPVPGSDVFDETVWASEPSWFRGGTTVVLRRIVMDLDLWDTATRAEQELSIGRRLSDGAPLTGGTENDDLDLTATSDGGRPAIAMRAHARLAHPQMNNGFRIFRKGLNYTHDAEGATESGLLFLSFQADIARQFVPMQQRLDLADLLNEWTVATGSAVFAILPGFEEGGWLGDTLLS